MSSTKQGAFYDEHPFDWVESYNPAKSRAYMSPLLLQAIDGLDRIQRGTSSAQYLPATLDGISHTLQMGFDHVVRNGPGAAMDD